MAHPPGFPRFSLDLRRRTGRRRAGPSGLLLVALGGIAVVAAAWWLAGGYIGASTLTVGPGQVDMALVATGVAPTPPSSPVAVSEPSPTPAQTPTAEPDPLAEALARSNPVGRGDDSSAQLPGWPFAAPDPERQADEAVATPVSGPPTETYVVASGDTLFGIAQTAGVDVDRLVELNKLTSKDSLSIGQRLLVPAAGAPVVRPVASSRASTLRPHFIWPVHGYISTYYDEVGSMWIGGHHSGLDIAAVMGQPILAADAGKVLEAGWAETRGYGNYVLIDHGAGYQSLYGHMSVIRAKVGQEIKRGQQIGDVGSTGVSTGPHLHFEVRLDGHTVDPLSLLP